MIMKSLKEKVTENNKQLKSLQNTLTPMYQFMIVDQSIIDSVNQQETPYTPQFTTINNIECIVRLGMDSEWDWVDCWVNSLEDVQKISGDKNLHIEEVYFIEDM